MTAVTATADVLGLLDGLTATTEIRGPDGRTLGYYTPAAEQERQMYDRAKRNIDLAELERREKSNEPGFFFQQVMDHLKSLEAQQCGSR